MNRFSAVLAAVAASLFLAGCMVETGTFLSDPSAGSIDERLIGNWRPAQPGKEDNGSLVVSRRDGGSQGTLDVTLVSPDPDEKPGRMTVWTTKIGKLSFLNVKGEDPDGEDDLATVVAYRFIGGDTLEIGLLDAKAFAELVETGRLKGKVTRSFGITGVKLSGSREALIQTLRNTSSPELVSFEKESQVLRMKRVD